MNALRRAILHPFLMAVYPVLALLAFNLGEMYPWNAFRSLVVSLLGAGFFFLVLCLLLRNPYKAGILLTFFLLLFYSYGHVYTFIEDRTVFGINVGRHRVLLLIWFGFFCMGSWWVVRKKGDLYGINQSLNIVTMVVMVFPIFQIISFEVRPSMAALGANPTAGAEVIHLPEAHPNGERNSPDIYYIILDGYTRGDTLEKYFNYDNTPFLDKLTGMGFYVATCSQSNYSLTQLSLTSSLNLNYLDQLVPDFMALKNGPEIEHSLILNNEVIQALKRSGYKIVVLESGYPPTELRKADLFLSYNSGAGKFAFFREVNSFETLLLRTTLGLLLYEAQPRLPAALQILLDSTFADHRDRILYSLDELPKIPDIPGPKFVFTHLLLPHKPFLFGPTGQILEQKAPFTLTEETITDDREEYANGYRWQVEYLNKRLETILEGIIRNSEVPPIIIIQGDHGPSPNKSSPRARMTILNAYHLPGGGEKGLYPSISPVNSFRVVFDYYFGSQLGLLDDLSYYYDFRKNTIERIPNESVDCERSG